jgi:hypothetical protein
VNRSGGTYLIRTSQLTPEDGVLLQAVASINLDGKLGSLSRQVDSAAPRTLSERPLLAVSGSAKDGMVAVNSLGETKPALEYENGRGGFNAEGDYLIALRAGQCVGRSFVQHLRQIARHGEGENPGRDDPTEESADQPIGFPRPILYAAVGNKPIFSGGSITGSSRS